MSNEFIISGISNISDYFTDDKIGKEFKVSYEKIMPATGSYLLRKAVQGIFLDKRTEIAPIENGLPIKILELQFLDSLGNKEKIHIQKDGNFSYFGASTNDTQFVIELL